MKRVAFWGTPPPPIGGMTVHIERLSQRLAQVGISYEMYNFTGKAHPSEKTIVISNLYKWYLGLLLGSSADVHYVISTRTFVRFLAVFFALVRRKKVILRVGGKSLEDASSGPLIQRLMSHFAIRFSSAFIGVSQHICEVANQFRKHNDAQHIPGFIPPVDTGETPPKTIQYFWKNSFPKIVVSGQILDKNDFDIYGMWDTLESVAELKKDYPNISLVIFSYHVVTQDKAIIEDYKKAITNKGLENNILIYESKTNLWPSLKYCDIFLRPSYTDGDANSLREALSLNTKSVASNAVARPEKTILYPTGNIPAMVAAIDQSINSKQKQTAQKSDFTDNASKIITLINSL